MKKKFLGWILFLITICNGQYVGAQELLTNVYGRQYTFLLAPHGPAPAGPGYSP